jgi:hypothetical protein
MAKNSLSPAFIVVKYLTAFAPHVMTVPMRVWSPDTGAFGSFLDWNSVQEDAETMLDGLVTHLVPFFPTSVTFTEWEIWTKADAAAPSILRTAKLLADQVGTDATPGWNKATEAIWVFKTLDNGIFKLDMLDYASHDNFNPTLIGDVVTAESNLLLFITDTDNAFSGRDDARPYIFIKITSNINQALRKQYRMV